MQASQTSTDAQTLRQAQELFGRGAFQESGQLFANLTAEDVDDTTRSAALYGLGVICLNEDRLGDAQSCLEDSFTLSPDHADAAYYLGVISTRHGDGHQATRWYARALVAQPDHRPAVSALTKLAAVSELEPAAFQPTAPPTPTPPPQPEFAAANIPPNPPQSPNSIIGIASGVRQQPVPWRGRPAGMVQLTFRVAAYTRDGKGPTGTFGVELRSHEVHGAVLDGDWVEMPPGFDPRRPGKVKEVTNLSTLERVFTKYRILTG